MNPKPIKASALLVVCLATMIIAQGQDSEKRKAEGIRISIDQMRDYRKMFRVNERPMDMVEQTKVMCAPAKLAYGPHYDPGVVYYINEIARKSIATFASKKLFFGGIDHREGKTGIKDRRQRSDHHRYEEGSVGKQRGLLGIQNLRYKEVDRNRCVYDNISRQNVSRMS